MKLLRKEFRLCLHPTAPLMALLSALVLIPNYPYGVSFFYTTLGIYFICLSGRENHDAAYTLALPVSRADLVRGRMLLAACLELLQLALCAGFALLHRRLLGDAPNLAGMDANLALTGEGFLLFALFNAVFFPSYYKDINKVGAAFLKSSAAVFVFIVAAITACYAVPFVRDALDTPDPAHIGAKLAYLAFGLAVYAAATALSARAAIKRFEALDLQL